MLSLKAHLILYQGLSLLCAFLVPGSPLALVTVGCWWQRIQISPSQTWAGKGAWRAAWLKVHKSVEKGAWTSPWRLQLVAGLQHCFFPTVAALVGVQLLPPYEYSAPIKYAQYGEPCQGEDLEGSMNFVTALLSCRGTTDAAIDFWVETSPSFEQSSSLFAFHNSVITPRWQQDKGEATVQLFIPRELLCSNQWWWTPVRQASISRIWYVISQLSWY